MTMRESIELNERTGVKHTPELKEGDPAVIARVFGSQAQYAQRFADELRDWGVHPKDAFSQSFKVNDILYCINHTPYGRQATFLVDYDDVAKQHPALRHQRPPAREPGRTAGILPAAQASWSANRRPGDAGSARRAPGTLPVPSQLAMDLKGMGYDIITWTFERADLRGGASTAGFYYDFDPAGAAIKKDSDMYKALDVLARQVGILGIFSDWPATVSYYASCMGLK